jgi:hypothetical protein
MHVTITTTIIHISPAPSTIDVRLSRPTPPFIVDEGIELTELPPDDCAAIRWLSKTPLPCGVERAALEGECEEDAAGADEDWDGRVGGSSGHVKGAWAGVCTGAGGADTFTDAVPTPPLLAPTSANPSAPCAFPGMTYEPTFEALPLPSVWKQAIIVPKVLLVCPA